MTAKKLFLRGKAIDTSVNKNNWRIEATALIDFAKQLQGRQLRVDHGDSVRDVKGKVNRAWVEDEAVMFEADLVTEDERIITPVVNRLVDHVSVSADALDVICEECGVSTRPDKTCDHEAPEVVRKFELKELSMVATPAYDSTRFGVGFAAALDKRLKGGDMKPNSVRAEEERKRKSAEYAEETPPREEPEREEKDDVEELRSELRSLRSEMERMRAEVRKRMGAEAEERKAEDVSNIPKEHTLPQKTPAVTEGHSTSAPDAPSEPAPEKGVQVPPVPGMYNPKTASEKSSGAGQVKGQAPQGDSLQAAMSEIFSFAANRGTFPLQRTPQMTYTLAPK